MISRMAQIALASSLALATSATQLFIGSYGGSIITADLSSTGQLTQLSSNNQSAPQPSWQDISPDGRFLYSVEEAHSDGEQGVGGISSYAIAKDGSLERVAHIETHNGPVHLAISPNSKLLFSASYSYSSVAVYSNNPQTGTPTLKDTFEYQLTGPPANPVRQDAPHPHQVAFDPTGRYVLAPDLGADVLRAFHVPASGSPTPLPDIPVTPGHGPRHGLFVKCPKTGKIRYYLINEIANSVSVYNVVYGNPGISLEEIQTIDTLENPTPTNPNPAPWTTPSAAAYAMSPDKKHYYVSNRNDHSFEGTHSIIGFNVDAKTGKLDVIGWFDSGVRTPRHIALDPSGKFLLAEGQDSGNIKVLPRNQETGELGAAVSELKVEGGSVCITWRKEKAGRH